jgi:hypothetical protein
MKKVKKFPDYQKTATFFNSKKLFEAAMPV